MKPAYQLYADTSGALFIISAGDPQEADCLSRVTSDRRKAEFILAAVNAYAASCPRRKEVLRGI